jgi:hypothetical protein
MRHGEVTINATRTAGNAACAKDLTNAEIQLQKDIPLIISLFREESSIFKDCYLIKTATQAGIRETRAIEGLYQMTMVDILEPKNFPDTVAKGGHPIDIHGTQDSQTFAKFVGGYNIPYRSIVPKGSKNILVAGSLISADRESYASIRVQAQCMALGQAAGTAAAMCLQENVGVADLNGSKLNTILSQQGAIVDIEN